MGTRTTRRSPAALLRAWWHVVPAPNKWRRIAVVGILLIVGVAALVLGVGDRVAADRHQHWATTSGVVVDTERVPGGRHTRESTIRFRVDGVEHTLTSRSRTPFGRLRVGEWVAVSYDPGDPARAELAGTQARQGLIRLIVGGLLVLAVPVIVLRIAAVDLNTRREDLVDEDWTEVGDWYEAAGFDRPGSDRGRADDDP